MDVKGSMEAVKIPKFWLKTFHRMKKLQEESRWRKGNTLAGGTNTLKLWKNSESMLKGPKSYQLLDLADQWSKSCRHIAVGAGG